MQLYHDGEYLEEEAALGYLDEAIGYDPDLISARYQRAILLLSLGRNADALLDVDAILKIKPDHLRARFSRAYIMFRSQDYTSAIRDFPRCLRTTTPSPKHSPCVVPAMRKWDAMRTPLPTMTKPSP